MKRLKERYNCWFLINPHDFTREFEEEEKAAAKILSDFINAKDYGEGIKEFDFSIYTEQEINFGRWHDAVASKRAFLSVNLDFNYFYNTDKASRVNLMLNAVLVLLYYLKQKVVTPKQFNTEAFIDDYEAFLKSRNYYIPQDNTEDLIIKYFDTTKFELHVAITLEVNTKKIFWNYTLLQDYINNRIAGKMYGTSIHKFDFAYEIFDFEGEFAFFGKQTENLKRYGSKYKNLLVVKQRHYNSIITLTEKEQYLLLKEDILEAIQDVEKLNKKPKDFDREGFYNTIKKILNHYENEHYG